MRQVITTLTTGELGLILYEDPPTKKKLVVLSLKPGASPRTRKVKTASPDSSTDNHEVKNTSQLVRMHVSIVGTCFLGFGI